MNAPRCLTVVTLNVVSASSGLPRTMAILLLALLTILPRTNAAPDALAASTAAPIPLDRIGDTAGKQYQGDGLSVSATNGGALLRCVFQRMEGQVTREGLWLTSTADDSKGERFRVVATAVGRAASESAAVSETSRSARTGRNPLGFSTCCGWSRDDTAALRYKMRAPRIFYARCAHEPARADFGSSARRSVTVMFYGALARVARK